MKQTFQEVFDFAAKCKPKRIGNYRTTDYTGQRFGKLFVLEKCTVRYRETQAFYRCRCDCGTEKIVRSCALVSGKTRSCGCLQRSVLGDSRRTHGASHGRTYRIWQAMKRRCLNPNVPAYPNYGGRGITICREWRDNFARFLADMGEAPDKKSIERKDPNKGYCKSNCCWATTMEQGATRTNNIRVTYKGVTHHVAEWCRITGFGRHVILSRVRKGWTPERIIETPVRTTTKWY